MFFKKYICFILIILSSSIVYCQVISQAEFIDKPLKDILIAVGQMAGKTIIVDDSVSGNATHFFKDKTFDQIMSLLIKSHNLYDQIEGNVVTISRMKIQSAGNSISIDAENVYLDYFIRRLSRETHVTILFDQLPVQTITLHLEGVIIKQILETLVKNINGYALEVGDIYYYIKSNSFAANSVSTVNTTSLEQLIIKEDGKYSVKTNNVKLSDLLEALFIHENKEFMFMRRGDYVIPRLNYTNKSFEELLRLILQGSDSDFTIKDNVYYIIEINHSDVLKKFNALARIYLRHVSINQLINIMPSNLVNGVAIKTDKQYNSLVLSGSSEEINPLIDFIRTIDVDLGDFDYYRFNLSTLSPDLLVTYLPESIKINDPIILKAQNALVLFLHKDSLDFVNRLVSKLDVSNPPKVIALKYIKAEDLLSKLPGFITKDQISIGPDSRYLFFSGTESAYQQVLKNMKYIDQPIPQIKYQILVIQFQEDGANALNLSLNPSYVGTDSDTSNAFTATLEKLLSVNFNIVSAFGMNFAAKLNASLKKASANILVDTTLNGLTGQDVTFKNTNTTRTKDKETTTSNGTTTTTEVIRELVTGIQLTIKGSVSGEGLITMSLTASLSRAGSSSSESTLPPTYEKTVTTSVRTQSGKPTIISGLLQHEMDNMENHTPILSDIPLLGELMKGRSSSANNTELAIYVIPRIEQPPQKDLDLGDELQSMYDRLINSAWLTE